MKQKLMSNIGLKVLSLLLATLLWLGVINLQDPIETVTFTDIPVTIINEDALTAKDKIPEVVEGGKVSVVVEARRKICDSLTRDNIVAVADFSKISLTDAVPIEISVLGYSDREVEIIRGMNQVMKLRLEDLISKDFRVKISEVGEPAEGYVIGNMVASPNMIRLTGSQTQINRIEEVVLLVNVDGVSSKTRTEGVPMIYDVNGEMVDLNKVSMSAETVSVTIPVLPTKTVRIYVDTSGTPAEGYEVASVSYQPHIVTIAGEAEELAKVGAALRYYCDVTGQNTTIEENIDISSLWNSELQSLRLVDEEELAITVTFKELTEVPFKVLEEDIEIKNCSKGLAARIKSLMFDEVIIQGKEAKIKRLTFKALAPYIDLSDYKKSGTYWVKVEFGNMMDFILKDEVFVEVDIGVIMQEEQIIE